MTESARLQQSRTGCGARFRVRRGWSPQARRLRFCRLRDRRDIFHCSNLVTHDNVRCKCAAHAAYRCVWGIPKARRSAEAAACRSRTAPQGRFRNARPPRLFFGPPRKAPPARREATSFAAARRTRDQQPHAGCAQQRTQNGVAGTQARASHAQIDGRDIFERKGSAAIHECRTAHARPPARQRNKAVSDAIRKTVHRISADGLKAVLHQRVRRRQHACIRFSRQPPSMEQTVRRSAC